MENYTFYWKTMELKHQKDESEYPNIPPVSYETGSNTDGWKKRKFLFFG